MLTASAVYGSTTVAFCGLCSSSATTLSTAALFGPAVTFWPPGAVNTMRVLAPSAVVPGNRSCNRSKAFCAPVPGTVKLSAGADGAVAAPAREGEQRDPDEDDVSPSPEGEPTQFVGECRHGGSGSRQKGSELGVWNQPDDESGVSGRAAQKVVRRTSGGVGACPTAAMVCLCADHPRWCGALV